MEKDRRINPGHQYVMWIFRRFERFQYCAIAWQEQAIISGRKRLEFQSLDSYFRRLHAQAGKLLKLGERRRTDPCKEAAGQFRVGLLHRQLEILQWIRSPKRVFVTLLIQTAVGRNSPDHPGRLQLSKGHRKRCGQSLLLPLGTEIPYGFTCGLSQSVRVER